MKTTASLLILTLTALHSFGGTGPGPWAQGAYYPEQLDGKYAASVSKDSGDTSSTPVGGVIGFGLRSGAPTRLPATTGATVTPPLDTAANYYAIFRGGTVFTGTTIGFLDINKNRVSGSLVADAAAGGALAQGGGFAGKITSNKAIFTFRGTGTLGSTQFRLSGIKTSNAP
jgi:hypothetical protein